LFVNELEPNSRKPTLSGYITVGDENHRLSLWEKTASDGSVYYKGKINECEKGKLSEEEPLNDDEEQKQEIDEDELPHET
jgi:hypothetical protein